MDQELTINNTANEINENEDYNEEEDKDFVPDQESKTVNDEKEDEDEDSEGDEPIKSRNYSKIESDAGGLIKTRRGRQLEMEHMAKHKYDNIMVSADSQLSNKITDLWNEMQNESTKRLVDPKIARHSIISTGSLPEEDIIDSSESDLINEKEEKILIERSYKFAGETIHEKKWVLKSSAEAKEYLNSIKFSSSKRNNASEEGSNSINKDGEMDENFNNLKDNSENSELDKKDESRDDINDNKPKLRRPLKRPPILEDIISGALKPKLSTLEKSKLDWVQYVDKEGIKDELQYNKKGGGYLAKQDFLSRVESRKDAQYKEYRQKQLALKFQTAQR